MGVRNPRAGAGRIVDDSISLEYGEGRSAHKAFACAIGIVAMPKESQSDLQQMWSFRIGRAANKEYSVLDRGL